MEQVGSGCNEEIRQTRCDTRRDHRRPAFFFELPRKSHLLGSKGMTRVVRRGIEIVATQPKCSSHDRSIEHRGTGVNEQLRPPCGFQDAPHVSGIHTCDWNCGCGSQEVVCPFQITITACHPVTLSKQEFDNQRADCADAQDKDPHGAQAYHSSLAAARKTR